MSKPAKKYKQEKLRVVVVESHQQVLPYVHQALRRQKPRMRSRQRRGEKEDGGAAVNISPPPWTLVHFDSHADLACPVSLPARLCWRPYPDSSSVCGAGEWKEGSVGITGSGNRNVEDQVEAEEELSLYERLESTTSGIAEWILPLVLGANCAKIEWVRPPSCPRADTSNQGHEIVPPDPHAYQYQNQTRHASFPEGSHTLTVGTWVPPPPQSTTTSRLPRPTQPASFLDLSSDARVKVDSHEPYYADDEYDSGGSGDYERLVLDDDEFAERDRVEKNIASCYAPSHELLFSKTIPLSVRQLNGAGDDNRIDKERKTDASDVHAIEETSAAVNDDGDRVGPWILDICLDYFWCDNPFWDDLLHFDEPFARALSWLVCESILYNNSHHEASITPPSFRKLDNSDIAVSSSLFTEQSDVNAFFEHYDNRRRRVRHFRGLLRRFLRSISSPLNVPSRSSPGSLLRSGDVSSACAVIDARENASTKADDRAALLSYYPLSMVELASDYLNLLEARLASMSDTTARSELAEAAFEAVPYLTLPRDEGKEYDRTVASRLEHLRAYLTKEGSDHFDNILPLASLPLLVTVARSSRDGFLEAKRADELQQKVLAILHAYCDSCRGRSQGEPQRQHSPPPQHVRGTVCVERGGENDAVVSLSPRCSLQLDIVLDYAQDDGYIYKTRNG
jgi:hypothetical protein